MSEPFIASIIMFGGTFPPNGWALCNGQLLSISQNTALFSLLGTNYGGNGTTTFGLPDLRSRVPIHPGQGPGLSPYVLGQQGGTESNTLNVGNLAPHIHSYAPLASENDATSKLPLNNYLGATTSNNYAAAQDGTRMGVQNTDATGNGQPFPNIQPYTCVNFIIALVGIYPSRN